MILPAIVLGTIPLGGDRAYDPFVDAPEVLGEDYIRTARAPKA